jgi:Ca2+-binding RTX toxin-like protein
MQKTMMLAAMPAVLVAVFATAAFAKIMTGTNEYDRISGTPRGDQINALDSPDGVYGNAGNDDIYGGEGADGLFGGLGGDAITGGKGQDTIDGGYGNDHLYASDGTVDFVTGGPGIDIAWVDRTDDVAPDVEYVNGVKQGDKKKSGK